MCRGFKQNEGLLLRIKSFHTHLSAAPRAAAAASLPDFLTLHYLPRINGALLEISGSYIRPDSPAFVTLHRILSSGGGFSYASREKVVACEGARFEIYVGDVKLLKGIFRRDDGGDERENSWKIDCKCALSADDDVVVEGVRDAEVSVTVAGDGPAAVVVTEKVEMAAPLRRRRRRGGCCELEEIPEEREGEIGSDACCCCCDCGGGEEEMDGGDGGVEVEAEMEAVRWALDVGIWVVCIGVGYLVTKASSSKRLRRKRFI